MFYRSRTNLIHFILLTTCMSLVIVLGRCSPISPSTYKSTLNKGETEAQPPQQIISQPSPTPSADSKNHEQTQKPIYVFIHKTKVIDSPSTRTGAYTKKITLSQSQKTIFLSAKELPVEFDEFRKTGKTTIDLTSTLDGLLPEEGSSLFEISTTEDDLESHDIDSFDTVFKPSPLDDGKWTLTVSSKTDQDISRWIMKNLISVTLNLTVVIPATTPSPSPLQSEEISPR
ncbi:MAG: hypothetical protein AAB116_27065 [Candidatus Poribacteria bacterium]